MKTYTIEVVIEEGNDEFWENLEEDGCADVFKAVRDALWDHGFQAGYGTTVRMVKFEDKE